MAIEIRQTMGAIGIEIQKAAMEIRQSRPNLNIKSIPANFRINKKLPRFKIQQNEYLAASHFYTNTTLASINHDKALQNTIDAIGKIASEGDAIMRIENRGNVISQLSLNNSQNDIDLSVGMLPRNELQWDPGYINIDWTPHQLEFNWEVAKPQITVRPHSVKVYMRKWPSIDISVADNETPYGRVKGKKIDKKV